MYHFEIPILHSEIGNFEIYFPGAERAFGKFIFSYSVEGPPGLSSSDATVVETVFWATFTAGRGT